MQLHMNQSESSDRRDEPSHTNPGSNKLVVLLVRSRTRITVLKKGNLGKRNCVIIIIITIGQKLI